MDEINETGEIDPNYVAPECVSIRIEHPEGIAQFSNFWEFRKRSKEQMRAALK